MGKLPWFKFNVYDWLSSETVMLLSWAQRGIYMQLLAHSWVDNGCSIPKDLELVKKLCPKAKTKDICVVLAKCFESEGEEVSRLKNMRLKSTYSEALVKSDKARASRNIGIIKQRLKSNVERTYNDDKTKRSVDVEVDKEVDKEKHKHIYGEYKHVKLTEVQYQKLLDKFGEKREYWIKELDEGIEYKGYKYKNHYLSILKWDKKEKKDGKSSKSFHERDVEEAARVRKAARSFFGVHRGSVGLGNKPDKDKTDRGPEDSTPDGVIDVSPVENSKT
jgi:uncharacterized protein YdaU (DUF1376 family)